ncbi:hypothetical protein SCD90_04085 [Terrihabitans sp. PJ23]|jgi:hypothetical protein|uniref:Uncharacterized protein n=1 Tax=Terrihabitans rhizophilus TaxID=3092662 RepID=A0ABU4RK72_9HYPH|nr:hypothetical protein [Terrihabitans sp. PJ23]
MTPRLRLVLVTAALGLALSGCDTARSLNPFAEKEKALPGERRPVFAPGDPFAGPRRLPSPNSEAQSPTVPAASAPR